MLTDSNDHLKLKAHLQVLRCQVGDEQAFRELFDLNHQNTLRFLKSLVNGEEANDLNQEVWLTVYKRIASLSDANRFKTWIFQIARNKALDHFRKTKRAEELRQALKAEVELMEKDTFAPELTNDFMVTDILKNLSVTHREALTLHYLEGMDYEEIAMITSSSLGTVKSRIHNAKLKIKEQKLNKGNHERS